MTKTDKNSPTGENHTAQVVDIIESGNSPTGKNLQFGSALELVGAIKHQQRLSAFSEATLVIELAKVQSAYRGHGNLHLTSEADSFKEFVENAGLNYKTITNKISHLKAIGPQMLQMFESLGVPMTLQRQIKALPDDLREKLGNALAGSLAKDGNEVMEIFKQVTAHTVALQDKLDEASTKSKVDLIDERDRSDDRFELAEDRMINMTERTEKLKGQYKKLLASQNIDDKTAAVRKMNDTLSIYFNALKNADLSADDLDLRTEKNRFLDYISQAHEMGLS